MAFLKTIWKTNSRHEKLSEELALQNSKIETESSENSINTGNDVVTFKLKYLGSTVVESKSDNNNTTEIIKNILKTAKAVKGRKKLQRVNVTISLEGIDVTDIEGNDILKVSIYRISNCSTDPTHRQIFSFSSTDENNITQCHAFLCSRRKTAETITLAVGHAFNTVYQVYSLQSPRADFQKFDIPENIENNVNQGKLIVSNDDTKEDERLINFDDEPIVIAEGDLFAIDEPPRKNYAKTHWVCFDDDFISESPSKTTKSSEGLWCD